MKDFILTKLKEGSTWAGIAVVIGGMSFIPHSTELAVLIPPLGVVVSGLLAIFFK